MLREIEANLKQLLQATGQGVLTLGPATEFRKDPNPAWSEFRSVYLVY